MPKRNDLIRLTVAVLAVTSVPPASAQQPDSLPLSDPSLYRVYTGEGVESSIDELIRAAGDVEVVLLGESHNDRIGHALQLQIFERVAAGPGSAGTDGGRQTASSPPDVVLSMEMFERDIQYVLDEYLADLISETQFRRSSRPWAEYEEDYRPVVESARKLGIPVVAANAPRRYINMVSREGPARLVELSDQARHYLAPLPHAPPSDAYRAELEAIFAGHGGDEEPDSASRWNGMLAQSLWDATMAYSVAEVLTRRPGSRVVHLVGSFHVRNGTGIPEQLERYRPGTSRLIVLIEPVDDVTAFSDDVRGGGDFVILTDKSRSRAGQLPGL